MSLEASEDSRAQSEKRKRRSSASINDEEATETEVVKNFQQAHKNPTTSTGTDDHNSNDSATAHGRLETGKIW